MNAPHPDSSSAGASERGALENTEWRAFLLQQYYRSKASNPRTTLRSVYPIAKRKFEARNKRCDVDLSLIANHHKHKK